MKLVTVGDVIDNLSVFPEEYWKFVARSGWRHLAKAGGDDVCARVAKMLKRENSAVSAK